MFLDLKLHDIPRTVAHTVERLASVGADFLTIHTAGGRSMLEAAAAAAPTELSLLGVTILTSLDSQSFSDIGGNGDLADVVLARARHAQGAGLAGVVASAHEVAQLRPGRTRLLVGDTWYTFSGQSQGDRVSGDACNGLADGASMLVSGAQLPLPSR